SIFDRDISAFHIAVFAQTLVESAEVVHESAWRLMAEKAYHQHPGLLRARRNRPRGCRAAKEGDELASRHRATLPGNRIDRGCSAAGRDRIAKVRRIKLNERSPPPAGTGDGLGQEKT